MSRSNPQIAIDSLPLTKSFQLGNVVSNKLVPDGFSKSQNFYLKTWREQSCQNSSWGETWNYVLPESLNVVSSHFLEIDLNQLAAGNYKKYPGMYAINRIKLLSNGSEVYDWITSCTSANFFLLSLMRSPSHLSTRISEVAHRPTLLELSHAL